MNSRGRQNEPKRPHIRGAAATSRAAPPAHNRAWVPGTGSALSARSSTSRAGRGRVCWCAFSYPCARTPADRVCPCAVCAVPGAVLAGRRWRVRVTTNCGILRALGRQVSHKKKESTWCLSGQGWCFICVHVKQTAEIRVHK